MAKAGLMAGSLAPGLMLFAAKCSGTALCCQFLCMHLGHTSLCGDSYCSRMKLLDLLPLSCMFEMCKTNRDFFETLK